MGRYRGSVLGLLWSFFNPLVMILVYTFVFGVVFQVRWPGSAETKKEFAVVVFSGVAVFTLFSEVVGRAPALIISNPNFVKKVVFPLEILPCVTLGTSLFHTAVSLLLIVSAHLLFNSTLHWTVIFAPIVLLPILAIALGCAWILASVGTFLRDVGQIVGVGLQILLFMSPIFYPLSAVPESLRPILSASPLAFVIQQMRNILIFGQIPLWSQLALHLTISILVCWVGLAWFQKTRNWFANVL